MKRLDRNEPCPCGSKETYGKCCWDKDFEFRVDGSGEIFKAIKNSDGFREYMNEQVQMYKEIFNREPLPDEPAYLWSLLYSDEDYDDNIEDHLRSEGYDEAFIYAHKKTRLTVTEERLGLFSKAEIDEWETAIQEFYDKQKNPDKYLRKIHKIQYYLEQLEDHIEQLLFQYHLLIYHQNQSIEDLNFKNAITSSNYLNFILTKNLKTLKAIIELHKKGFGTDCLALVRSQLENYKELINLKYNQEECIKIATARVGLKWNTHEYYKKSNGKTDYGRILEKSNNEILRMRGGHSVMENSPHTEDVTIYSTLQDKFSTFVHSDTASVSSFLDKEKDEFSATTRSFITEVPYYLIYINTLIVSELVDCKGISKRSSLDLKVLVDRLLPVFQRLYTAISEYPEFSEIISNEEISRIAKIKNYAGDK